MGTRDPEGFWSTYRHPRRCPAVVEPLACDVSDAASITQAIAHASPTRVFIALPQALSPGAMVSCGKACVDAAKAAGVARMVRLSSLGIDGDSGGSTEGQGPLGDAHVAIETHARDTGLPFVSVRPTSFHSNLLAFDAETIRAESCFRSPLGVDAKVNWVHCRDIGAVCAVALRQPDEEAGDADDNDASSKIINVTGASTLSAPEMATLLSAELGRTIAYHEVPVRLLQLCDFFFDSSLRPICQACCLACCALPMCEPVRPLSCTRRTNRTSVDGVQAPPVPEYQALWSFLRRGGFDRHSNAVHEMTGALLKSARVDDCVRQWMQISCELVALSESYAGRPGVSPMDMSSIIQEARVELGGDSS
eukprot:COSAG02_NODE_64_length_43111_cov_35.627709_21_plen_364_part_00